ncbi:MULTISPECIES: CBS domain-containing protein [Pseudovibrio]|uniref:CBS domain-containing protein n=1 Tax=Stappiaceae TaxID=2821832 RepID=UPI0023658332|nr:MULTISPECIES: CBS domain-containing protein [Pseudovibrio]MDD7910537.1 CBS domain-containing protein [Pseudovibrio exalbescens]MDX5594614.1 CBS domain-containing protein [Pseudovibrio sp. SPO723]
MTVAAILNSKGREVFTESADKTLAEIAASLGGRRIGAVVICREPGVIAGILSERDIVSAIALHGSEALERPVTEYMTETVITCSEKDTINSVMGKMTAGRFRHVPVVENGKLCGLISIGDVVKYRIAEIEREAEELRSYIHTA